MAGHTVDLDWQYTLEKQTVWGTPVDTVAALVLPTEMLEIVQDADVHDIRVARGIRGKHEDAHWSDKNITLPTVQGSMPATPQLIVQMLPYLLQAHTAWTADGSDNWKMYPHLPANLPKPKATNNGYYGTIMARSPQTNDSIEVSDAVLQSLKLSLHPTENDSVLWMDTQWLAANFLDGQEPSATPVLASIATLFEYANLTSFTWGGADIFADLFSIEWEFTFGAKRAKNNLPSGELVLPEFSCTTTFKMEANATAEAMKAEVLATGRSGGKHLKLQWGNGTPAAAGEANIWTFGALVSAKPDYKEGEMITFTQDCMYGDYSGADEYPFLMTTQYA